MRLQGRTEDGGGVGGWGSEERNVEREWREREAEGVVGTEERGHTGGGCGGCWAKGQTGGRAGGEDRKCAEELTHLSLKVDPGRPPNPIYF